MKLQEKENNYMKLLRENFTLIVAVPTLLGGLWQVSQLVKIAPVFLRFFSLTQLVSDGLFITLLIFISVIIPFLMAFKLSKLMVKHLSVVWVFVLNILAILVVITLLLFDFDFEKKYFVYIIVFMAFVFFLNILLALNEDLRKIVPTKYDKIFLIVMTYLLIPMALGDICKLVNEFSKSNEKLENLNLYEKSIQEKYPCAKLEYFNDKYVFIQLDSMEINKSYLIKDLSDLIKLEGRSQ
ncbi:MAG: hypothetical protein RLZZ540_2560 [Bacteroidota bacterium]|jgi:hypothetical protein